MYPSNYDVATSTINEHIMKIYSDGELTEEATIRNFRIVQTEGVRQVNRNVIHYNLQMIIAVGFKVQNERAVHFRKWAGQVVKDYTIQGWTYWENAPDGKIVKSDVSIAKNYLTEKEMNFMERIVSLYLDYAELQAERHIPMSMEDWAKRLDGFLEFNGTDILMDAGKISAEQAKLHAETEFEKYRIIQDKLFMSDYDRYMLELEEQAKNIFEKN